MSQDSLDRRSLIAVLVGTSAACMACGFSAEKNAEAGDPGYDAGSQSTGGQIQLQAIGALGVGHIQSTLGLIGVIADSVTKEIYSQKQIEDLMQGTINGLELPKKMLRRLQDANISPEDAEFLDRMISVFNALQKEANALIVYSKSRKIDDAQKFERERRLVIKKLSDLTQRDEFLQPETLPQVDAAPRTVPVPSVGPKK